MNTNRDILADKLDFTYKKEESVGELRNFFAMCMDYWYIFLASLLLCLGITFICLQYIPGRWAIQSKIIVDEDKNGPEKSLTNGANADLASLFDIKSNADNEVKVLESRSLLKSVIYLLNMNVHVYDDDSFYRHELYSNAPFAVSINAKTDTTRLIKYSIKILDNDHYQILDHDNGVERTSQFGKPLQMHAYTFTINKTDNFRPEGDYNISILPIKEAEKQLGADFTALIDDKKATVIDLRLNYPDPYRGEQILQKLMQLYISNNLANKVRLADSTMKFIDRRLVVIGTQLNDVEKDLEHYKVQNKISDINAQSKALVEGADDYQNKLNDNQVQLAVVDNMYKYVDNANKPQVIPSTLITKDGSFGSAINEYNSMLLKREQLKMSFVDNSPVIANLDQQIETARESLVNNLKNYRTSLQVSMGALRKQDAGILDKITDAPVKERIYLDYTRQQSLKQDLYLFLLQRREETAISQTATLSNCRILDNAESDDKPFEPKKSLVYLIGLLAGFALPIAGLSVKEAFNIKIQNKADIEKHSNIPLLGEISRLTGKKKLPVYNDPLSVIAEEVRAIRTNLKYITDKNRSNVILFTSSMSGEGKSFISLNLASSIALSDKKVVLLELDLRKPKMLKDLGVNNDYGFTSYMISEDADLDRLLIQSPIDENLYMIPSGPVPPNPAELLMNNKLGELVEELRRRFDYIIIDTAPVGLVSDALLIEEFADITCFVIRQDYTYKSQLGIVNDLQRSRKVKQLYLVVNDIKLQKNAVTGFGHGYRSYGYTAEQQTSPGMLNALLKRIKPVTR